MRKIFICLLTLLALTIATAYAGSGHSHGPSTPIAKEEALIKATGIVKDFVEKGKVDSSWAEVAPASGKQNKRMFGDEWVVAFNNPKIKDTEKQTLYLFLTLAGEYKAANYTGI
jgi:hypothetical protein